MFHIPRDRLLAIILAIVAALYFTQDAVTGLLTSPFASRQRTRDALARKVADADREVSQIEHAQKGLRDTGGLSLPSDTSVAVALYQEWLIQLAQETGLTEAVVTPGTAVEELDIGYRIPMTLQATAQEPQLGRFLDQFQQTPLLHRILHLSLVNADAKLSSAGALRVSIQIEGLSLLGSEPRQVLFPSGEPRLPAGESNSPLTALLHQNRLFARLEPSRPTPVEDGSFQPTPPEPSDPLSKIRFVGTWRTPERQEAWFLNESGQGQYVVTNQSPLKIDSLVGRLLQLTNDSVTLDVSGHRHELTLGESLEKLQTEVTQ